MVRAAKKPSDSSVEVDALKFLIDRVGYVDDDALERREKYDRFMPFVEDAWSTVEPHTEYVPGIHIDAMAEHLEAVTKGDIRFLLITLPPRMTKSMLISIMWPAWEWTTKPWLRDLCTSYSLDLALDLAVKSRRLIQSPWYQSLWSDKFKMTTDQNVKHYFENDHGGARYSVSLFGSILGFGGDRIVVDDPHAIDPKSGQSLASPLELRQAADIFDKTLSQRQNNPNKTAFVVVHQRIDKRDLAGHLIDQGGWVHLNLPQEHDGRPRFTTIGWKDPRTEKGELLCPERFGPEANERAKISLGADYSAQHNQDPSEATGQYLPPDRWGRWDRFMLPLEFQWCGMVVDSADGIGANHARTAIQIWGEDYTGWWLLYSVVGQWEFPELLETLKRTWGLARAVLPAGRRPMEMVIEARSTGPALVASMAKTTRIPARAYNPKGNLEKDKRVKSIVGFQNAGKLIVPVRQRNLQIPGLEFDPDGPDGFVKECADYPGRYVDQPDAAALMLHYREIAPPEEDDNRLRLSPIALSIAQKGKPLGLGVAPREYGGTVSPFLALGAGPRRRRRGTR